MLYLLVVGPGGVAGGGSCTIVGGGSCGTSMIAALDACSAAC